MFRSATGTPAFLEAVQFYFTLLSEGVVKIPDAIRTSKNSSAAAWDWYLSEFIDGRVAMVLAPEWAKTMFGEMTDDYGMVMPPKGPRASGYRLGSSCTVFGVPSYFKKEEVDAILTAYLGWTSHLDTGKPFDPDGWKEGHWWAHRDTRAVNETGVLQRTDSNVTFKTHYLVPGYNEIKGEFTAMMIFASGTPVQFIEEFTPRWQAAIDDANR
jgi:hypothetical protein